MTDLCFLSATELSRLIHSRAVSAQEVLEAHLDQIDRVNPEVNAIVTLVPERAREEAAQVDAALARNKEPGLLTGLPVAHKDLIPTRGIRTTYGSPIFADHAPEMDAIIVERLRRAGAITVGKTNTPEFGAGSQTFNRVFGATLNPYDTAKTCGGSSGGAAVALACGMVPLADGTDLGGSLRNPASFCNVAGFRPSPGRVPVWPAAAPWFGLDVQGPMARTVRDVALMLDVMAGPDSRAPLSSFAPRETYADRLQRNFSGVRIAWSSTGGGLPVDPWVVSVLESCRATFETIGCVTEDAFPDLADTDEVFKTWRAWYFELAYGPLLEQHHQMKDTVVWNIEEGRKVTGPQLARAERLRADLYHRVRTFMQTYEFLALPVTQVPPFGVTEPYVTSIAGTPMTTYIDWMRSCYQISVLSLPAISVPAGFTPDGLPVGLQIVGRYQCDLDVLRLAHAFEQATGFWKRRPPVVEG